MLCGSLDGRGVWGRMDTRICMAESFCSSPETITTLLIGYTPTQNKLKNKCTCNFIRNCQIVFQSDWPIFHTNQPLVGDAVYSHLGQHWYCVFFFLFHLSHSDRCTVMSHHGFSSHPLWESHWTSSQIHPGCLAVLLMKYLFTSVAHFLIGLFFHCYFWEFFIYSQY